MIPDNEDGKATVSAATKGMPVKKIAYATGLVVLVLLLIVSGYYAFMYFVSPPNIRTPEYAHYHFRMQVLVNGKAEDFGSEKYQRGYPKDQCSAKLTEQPIHFHDNRDQFVHIHWQGVTGGQVLKYYGWNEIGGLPDALGYKLDEINNPVKVTAHGNYLPQRPEGTRYYVYVGDEKGYQERSWDDFIRKDLEDFFGKSYDIPKEQQSFLDRFLFTRASAHADPQDADGDSENSTQESETDEETLTRINTLVGNVVIFAQKDKPTDEEIKARFSKLVPLGDSTCGG